MSESPHHLYRSQVEFSSDQTQEGSPETEFLEDADQSYELDFRSDDMEFDDGAEHEMWFFETDEVEKIFPSPLLRVTEGEIFHGTVSPSKGAHTIHWHGIEPDPRNDGVGHTSFEVSGHYTYQWIPEISHIGDANSGAAGTYFYHCHVNTPLHVQMGMFGPVVIDPVVDPNFPVRPNTRRPFIDGPEYDIETEAIIVPYSLDPRWHELNHAAGLSGEDVGLDRFEPAHFYLLGGEIAKGPNGEGPWQVGNMLRCKAPGQDVAPTLVRLLNANYYPVDMHFTDAAGTTPVPMAELISHDGRPFRDTSDPAGESPPVRDTGNPLMTSIINFGAAERYDILLHPPAAGTYTLTVDLLHWITEAVLFTRVITITAE